MSKLEFNDIVNRINRQYIAIRITGNNPVKVYMSYDVFVTLRKCDSVYLYLTHGKWTIKGLQVFLVHTPCNNLEDYIEVI